MTKCVAIIESENSWDGATYYSMQGIVSRGSRQCSRRACEKVGHLDLCKVHARLAREGMIDANGHMAARASINDARRFPKKFPGGLYRWFTEKK